MKLTKLIIIIIFLLAFAISVSAQNSNRLPKFLSTYEYLLQSKVKGLEFSVSTNDDVARFFGDNCKRSCDYDKDWEIAFGYFNEQWTKKAIGENYEELYKPKIEFHGRLSSIILFPKARITISEDSISVRDRNFECSRENIKRKIKNKKINYKSVTCNNFKDIHVSVSDETDKNKDIVKGQLMYIYYRPRVNDKNIFYLVKKS